MIDFLTDVRYLCTYLLIYSPPRSLPPTPLPILKGLSFRPLLPRLSARRRFRKALVCPLRPSSMTLFPLSRFLVWRKFRRKTCFSPVALLSPTRRSVNTFRLILPSPVRLNFRRAYLPLLTAALGPRQKMLLLLLLTLK